MQKVKKHNRIAFTNRWDRKASKHFEKLRSLAHVVGDLCWGTDVVLRGWCWDLCSCHNTFQTGVHTFSASQPAEKSKNYQDKVRVKAELTVFAIFFNPWYSFFSKMLFLFKSSCLNFHSTNWWSPMLPSEALDFVCSVWKMFNRAVLNATRSFGEHFFLGALMLAGEDRFKLPFPPQSGLPWFVCVFWMIFPWLLTHQQPLFSRHWIGAKDPSSRHLGTNFILGRWASAYDLDARQPSDQNSSFISDR